MNGTTSSSNTTKQQEEYHPDVFRSLLRTLLTADDPSQISTATIRQCLQHVLRPHASSPAQTGALLSYLRLSGIDRRSEVIAEAAQVMRELYVAIDIDDPNNEGNPWVDIVGTGGDGKDTFNVSTSAGIVAAGAGCRVAKHGNRASSSTSGSADVLIAMGAPVTTLPPKKVPDISKNCNFLFLFAPLYHPSLGHLAPLRREVGFPTLFNVLGPLVNPANPRTMIIGVSHYALGPIFAESLRLLGVNRAWVVCGQEGLDEISISGPSDVWEVTKGNIEQKVIAPEDFGLQRHDLSLVAGGTTANQNAETLTKLLNNELNENDPIENFVMINAAALLVVAGKTDDPKQAVALARQAIASGQAMKALDTFKQAAVQINGNKLLPA